MDIKEELAKIKFFDIKPNLENLKDNEKQALTLCIEASKILDRLFLKQVCGDKLDHYLKTINNSSDKEFIKKFFKINGGPWSRFHDDKPFIKGVGTKPKGVSFYPEDLTLEKFDQWLKEHPEDKKAFESTTTVIRRNKEGNGLIAIPYSELFKEDLKKVSKLISQASDLLKKGPLHTYLKSLSKSLLTNTYKDTDIAWVKTDGSPFEMVLGPIEAYEDKFKGFKATFESFIGIPNKETTEYLETFKEHVHELEEELANQIGYEPKKTEIPMTVFQDVFRSGEAAVGRQFVAANLPNDRQIHEKYGSKKVFSETMMKAKSDYLGSKVAEKLLPEEDSKLVDFNARLLFVLAHEISHGIGPGIVEKQGEKIVIEKLLGNYHSSLEECKADCLGMIFINFLIKKEILSEDIMKPIILSEIMAHFSGWRSDFTGAHNLAGLLEYDYLKKNNAVVCDMVNGKISIDIEKAYLAFEMLAYDIMKIQRQGNYEEAKKFIENHNKPHEEIKILLKKLKDIPLEVYPVFE